MKGFPINIITACLGLGILIIASSFYPSAEEDKKDTIVIQPGMQYIKAKDLEGHFSFAGEEIPKDNFDALERFDRELIINTYLHAGTILNMKNAARYFPVIEPILKKHSIPDDFKYLCVAESNLRMAISSAGAKGLWQFMEPVGRAYGLEINDQVDERYHIEKSTEAACLFLLDLKKRFGSWLLAAAAYNMGETGLAKRMATQKMNSYFDLQLPEETSRYVFRIFAIKEIMSHPEKYGYFIQPSDQYPAIDDWLRVPVTESIGDLATFAIEQGTTYRKLKLYNAWLLTNSLHVTGNKMYEIKIPKSPK